MRALAIALLMIAGGSASAVEIEDDGLRFEMGDTPRCVFLPRALQIAADCNGADLSNGADTIEAVYKRLGDHTVPATVLWNRPGGASIVMSIVASPAMVPTYADVADYLAGMHNSLAPSDQQVSDRRDPRIAYEVVTIAGSTGFRHVETLSDRRNLVAITLFGARHRYDMTFVSLTSDPTLPDFAGQTLKRLVLPEVTVDQRKAVAAGMNPSGFGVDTHSKAYKAGLVTGAIFLVFIASMLWRRRGRIKGGLAW